MELWSKELSRFSMTTRAVILLVPRLGHLGINRICLELGIHKNTGTRAVRHAEAAGVVRLDRRSRPFKLFIQDGDTPHAGQFREDAARR